jgi:hypothetical protein
MQHKKTVGVAAGVACLLGALYACSSDETKGAASGVVPNLVGEDGSAGTDGSRGNATGGPCEMDPGWPKAPELTNVRAEVRNDSLELTFDGVDDAKDYRVYALPAAGDVTVAGDAVTIKNGTYRCAGERTAAPATLDDSPQVQSGAVRTRVASTVEGFARTFADATLGYVYTAPGAGRLPVYALGNSDAKSDNACFFQRWSASRVKVYTTSETERAALLAKRYRDDGIVFYVPEAGAAGTAKVYSSGALYVAEGGEKAMRMNPQVQFSVLSAAVPDTRPLMRVYYENGCGNSHDELVASKPAFELAYKQGNQPLNRLHWSGLTAATTLVVEAVDALCPFQGHLATEARASGSEDGIDYPEFVTLDAVRAKSASGEAFINGQGGAANKPRAKARSCIKVAPSPAPKQDFSADFAMPETFAAPVGTGFKSWHSSSANFDVDFYSIAGNWFTFGQTQGELWVTIADWAADTNGKFRLTPKTKGALAADSYLHATFDVDSFTTGRRYAQVLISDQSSPVQDNLAKGSTVVVETINESPVELQVQLCDHRTWEVNKQCPHWNLYNQGTGASAYLAPVPELIDQAGGDWMNHYEVYVSTQRVYVMFDGAPFGCVQLTPGVMPAAPVTVTYGQVLYHSGVDLSPWNRFHLANQQVMTNKHWDNLGFSSKVAPPAWDENRFPCVPASARVD